MQVFGLPCDVTRGAALVTLRAVGVMPRSKDLSAADAMAVGCA